MLKASVGNVRQVKGVNAEFERSRSNSLTTLMLNSNSQSQTNEHDVVIAEPSSVTNKKSKTSSKSETATFIELNTLSKRYFLIYLFNTFINKSIRTVFLDMKSDHRIYKDGKLRI